MPKLNDSILNLSLLWTAYFIAVSFILTLIFCSSNIVSLIYHLFFLPLYFLVFYGIIFLIGWCNSTKRIKPEITILVYFIIVLSIIFFMQDFRSAFGLFKYSTKPFSIDRLIDSGCREMFYFLSFLTSSLVMSRRIIRYKCYSINKS